MNFAKEIKTKVTKALESKDLDKILSLLFTTGNEKRIIESLISDDLIIDNIFNILTTKEA